jgi:hypothetical protein
MQTNLNIQPIPAYRRQIGRTVKKMAGKFAKSAKAPPVIHLHNLRDESLRVIETLAFHGIGTVLLAGLAVCNGRLVVCIQHFPALDAIADAEEDGGGKDERGAYSQFVLTVSERSEVRWKRYA